MRSFSLLLLLTLSAHASIDAQPFPSIPRSSRVLTVEDVETYWFNVLRRTKIPHRPNGLYPEKQREWDSNVARLKQHLRHILNGSYRDEAEVVMLRHNIVAWERKEQPAEAEKCRFRLRAILEHQALMSTLAEQKQSVRRVAEASERQARAVEHQSASEAWHRESTIIVQSVESHCPPLKVHPTPQPCPPPQPVVPSVPVPDPPRRPFCPAGSPTAQGR